MDPITLQDLLPKTLELYRPWYDITPAKPEDAPLAAEAAFHEEGTAYVLSQRAKIWSADRHEYVWFFSAPVLTCDLYDEALSLILQRGETLVNPQPGHMSTNLVAVFLCEQAEPDALKKVKNCRIRKSFQFSLKGWMEVHTAVAECSTQQITSNPAGRNSANFLKNVFHPQKRKKYGILSKLFNM